MSETVAARSLNQCEETCCDNLCNLQGEVRVQALLSLAGAGPTGDGVAAFHDRLDFSNG